MASLKQISKAGAIVIIVIFAFIFMVIIPLKNKLEVIARNLVCGANLKGMSNAMNAYAFDYRDEYPIQGAGTHSWGMTTTGWDDPAKDWKRSTGTVTVSSSLYLLVNKADMGVKSFVCTASDQTFFDGFETGHDDEELWDFGPNPSEHVSYAYHFPYGKFPADGTSNPENALLADRSPWFDNKLTASVIESERKRTFADKVSLIDISKGPKSWKTRIGNSQVCRRTGQNVLFNDGHVMFERRPDVGFEDDNIYTIGGQTQEDKRRGIEPTADKIDAFDENDSLLVNDRTE